MSDTRRWPARWAWPAGDLDDDERGEWPPARIAACAVIGAGLLGLLAWVVAVKLAGRRAG